MKSRNEIAQQILQDKGLYTGKIDGDFGPKSQAALANYPGLDQSWGLERRIVGCIQLGCQSLGINVGIIDGRWGPATSEAADQYLYYKEHNAMRAPWRPEDRETRNPNNWPKSYTEAFDNFYGPAGESNLVRIEFPYVMKLAWAPYSKVTSTRVHKKVADSAMRVLTKVLAHYGEAKIAELKLNVFGGCYNKRPIRGGTKWSMHSWGVAFDFDPSRNQLNWGRDKASFAGPEYDAWWQFWEEEGWTSLGRERNFDWMHVQAAGI